MRIISASTLSLLIFVAAPAAQASDVIDMPVRIKRYASFAHCLTALKSKQVKEKATETTTESETEKARTVFRLTVSDVLYPRKNEAIFSVSGITTQMPKAGIHENGGTFGWGIDWYCTGRVMWKGGGHSAYVPIPTAPPMPLPPAPITPKS